MPENWVPKKVEYHPYKYEIPDISPVESILEPGEYIMSVDGSYRLFHIWLIPPDKIGDLFYLGQGPDGIYRIIESKANAFADKYPHLKHHVEKDKRIAKMIGNGHYYVASVWEDNHFSRQVFF